MSRKSFLTTFEISQLCEVNPTTVQNWVKEGKLKAFTTPGGHRRVRREDLVGFLKEFGMPLPAELREPHPYILIVDDESEVIDLLTMALRSGEEPLEVAGARGGVDALLLIGERKPDLLVLDILMPGMNGYEVCGKLKSNPVTRNIRIIAISGDHNSAVRERVLSAGADLFFAKPFDLVLFRDACFSLLHSSRGK
jgi:excisionase family DNA binding protein